jgi:hypothetical protein
MTEGQCYLNLVLQIPMGPSGKEDGPIERASGRDNAYDGDSRLSVARQPVTFQQSSC